MGSPSPSQKRIVKGYLEGHRWVDWAREKSSRRAPHCAQKKFAQIREFEHPRKQGLGFVVGSATAKCLKMAIFTEKLAGSVGGGAFLGSSGLITGGRANQSA